MEKQRVRVIESKSLSVTKRGSEFLIKHPTLYRDINSVLNQAITQSDVKANGDRKILVGDYGSLEWHEGSMNGFASHIFTFKLGEEIHILKTTKKGVQDPEWQSYQQELRQVDEIKEHFQPELERVNMAIPEIFLATDNFCIAEYAPGSMPTDNRILTPSRLSVIGKMSSYMKQQQVLQNPVWTNIDLDTHVWGKRDMPVKLDNFMYDDTEKLLWIVDPFVKRNFKRWHFPTIISRLSNFSPSGEKSFEWTIRDSVTSSR